MSAYGVIEPVGERRRRRASSPIGDMVEKPAVADAPSDLIIIGRYVLTADVFDEIDRLQPGAGGEIQLTDALRGQAAAAPFHGVLSDIAASTPATRSAGSPRSSSSRSTTSASALSSAAWLHDRV